MQRFLAEQRKTSRRLNVNLVSEEEAMADALQAVAEVRRPRRVNRGEEEMP